MNKFNLEKLVAVRVIDFYPSKWYRYLKYKPKKYFWQKERKEGVYFDMMEMDYIGEVPEYHILKNGLVYELPKVVMYFQNRTETIKYFDSLEEAQYFAESITQGKNWLLN